MDYILYLQSTFICWIFERPWQAPGCPALSNFPPGADNEASSRSAPLSITALHARDIRFPTSEQLDGSDAVNVDPDYSAAYLTVETDQGPRGYGLIFTIGRGNELCCQAVESLRHLVVGRDFNEIRSDIDAFYGELRSDSQLRWLGPEKGVIHMAVGGILNAVWDLWARLEKKPVWRLLCDMPPEQFVNCIDFRYIEDVLTREEALSMVSRLEPSKRDRIDHLERHGYPAYTTSAGWLGYSDEKLAELCRQALEQGFRHIKLKVGRDLAQDIRRCRLFREVAGNDVKLMVDANQIWEVGQAIDWINRLAPYDPWFVEEPTSPDDIFGHRKIRRHTHGVRIATGEHCQNRIMFKQLIANDAVDVVQIDACRLASLNEILAVCLIAAKYDKPVCPHAGGVGLCEYVQHLSMIDYVRISADLSDRVVEYVDHLHEHFETPCVVKNGAYMPPAAPGYSVRMHEETLRKYAFPHGEVWRRRLSERGQVG